MMVAGEPGGTSGMPAGPAPGKAAGGSGPVTPEGLTAPVVREGLTARVAPGWAFRQSGRSPAGGPARRIPGPSVGSASAGFPEAASGRAQVQAQGRGSVRSSATASQRGPGAAQGTLAVPDTLAAPGMLDGVRRRLAESGAEPTPARVAQALREQGRVLGDAEILGAAEQLRSELVGSGPLEPLLADPSVTDVLVSAPDRV